MRAFSLRDATVVVPPWSLEKRTRNRARCLAAFSFFFLRFSVPNECLISSVPVSNRFSEPFSVPSGILFVFPTVFGSKRVPNFRYSRRISWRIRLAGCRLCAAHRSAEFGECARALWTQRAEGSKAAEGRPMQRFLSALGSILQTLHWTKSKKVQCPKLQLQHKS